MQILKKVLKLIHAIEDSLIALILLAMILLAATDIVSRNFMGGGVAWIAPLIRVLVLWIGLQGALLATRGNEHISIDILARFLSDQIKRVAQSVTALFSMVVCLIIGWHSIEFVQGTFEYQDEAFSGLPAWPFQLIIPVSFMLMGLRFLIHGVGYMVSKDYDPSQAKIHEHVEEGA